MYAFFIKYSVYAAVMLGILAGIPLVKIVRKKSMSETVLLCIAFSAVSMVSVLLFASFEKIIAGHGISMGAVSTYGVYIIAPVILLALYRRDRSSIFDAFALYVLPSLFLQRIRCLFNGCCGGIQIAQTGMHWPVREAELLFYAVMLVILLRQFHNGAQPGILFPILMMSYGSFRFVEEFFREGNGLLHMAHLWSVLTILIGYSIYIEIRKHKK